MRAILMNKRTGEHRKGGEELISVWREDPDTFLWADLESVSEIEYKEMLLEDFGLDPLAVQDALRLRHPPKFEQFGNHLFMRVRGLDANTSGIDFGTIDISFFLQPRLLLTKRTGKSLNTERLWTEISDHPEQLSDPIRVGITLIGRVVRRYLTILLEFEPRLEELETEVFTARGDDLLAELNRYKTRLKELRRIFQYHDNVLATLQGWSNTTEDERLQHEIVDVHEQIQRALSLCVLYYEITADQLDAYLALSSHRLNQTMQVLTVVTVIFVPLSFLAGIYGMNFEYIPELKAPYGYFVLLGAMASVVAVQLLYFKRKGWLWKA